MILLKTSRVIPKNISGEAEDVLERTLVEVFSSITQGSLVECCFTIYTVTININKIYHG